jgi:hypothetical protein
MLKKALIEFNISVKGSLKNSNIKLAVKAE